MLLNQAFPDIFSTADAQVMSSLLSSPTTAKVRARIVRANVMLHQSLYLTRGMVGRYSTDRHGRRQFVGVQIPGDYFDIASYQLGYMDHDIDALSDVEMRPTLHRQLDEICRQRPDLASKLWKVSLIDASVHRYWIYRLGRLPGKARIANFIIETFVRLHARGLCGTDGYDLPVSQSDLAEITGMTSVHVNRMLGELRLDGLCTVTNGVVKLGNLPALARVGHYSPDYLYLAPQTLDRVQKLLSLRPTVAEHRVE
jgi:CRP-like cAMP-binding protein